MENYVYVMPTCEEMSEKIGYPASYHEDQWWIEVPCTTYGDYIGGVVEKANLLYLQKKYPNDVLIQLMDYGTQTVWANPANQELMEEIWSLEDYCLLDEKLHEEIGMETIMEYVMYEIKFHLSDEIADMDIEDVREIVHHVLFTQREADEIAIETGLLVYIPDVEGLMDKIKKQLKK